MTPWELKVSIDVKAGDISSGTSDGDAAEVDLLGEGLVLKLDCDLVAEEARRDGDRKSKSFWSIDIKVSLIRI